MNLHTQPIAALCDQKIDLCVSELPPNAKVKINAVMNFPWAPNTQFESAALFTANAQGEVDVSTQKPDSGSYDFINSMGLIVSMTSQNPKAMEQIARNISIDESLFIEISVRCGDEHTSVRLERWFKAPEVKREIISDGFVGEFFYSGNPQNQTIVWLGGSGSNLAVNALICAPLASHGFNVLSVPFFGEANLPGQLSRIPIEYFERVFDWLAHCPQTAGKTVQILGMSKGAEAALLLASRYPMIKKVAVWAPHAYCFQGLAFKNESSWTYSGKDIEYIRLKNRWLLADVLNCMVKNKPFGFTNIYKKGLALAKNKEDARIKIENARADLLLITGTDCGMWNTYDGCLEVMETLRKNNYPFVYNWVVYEQAGEPYLVPYVIPVSMNSVKMAPRLTLSTGGTLEGNARAQAGAWEKTLEFFSQEKY